MLEINLIHTLLHPDHLNRKEEALSDFDEDFERKLVVYLPHFGTKADKNPLVLIEL